MCGRKDNEMQRRDNRACFVFSYFQEVKSEKIAVKNENLGQCRYISTLEKRMTCIKTKQIFYRLIFLKLFLKGRVKKENEQIFDYLKIYVTT